MKLYTIKPQFDPDTGQPTEPAFQENKRLAVCDYTGQEVDLYNDDTKKPQYYISIRYDHSSEPIWEMELEDLRRFKEFGISDDYGEFGEFINSPYHFYTDDYGSIDASFDMIKEWMIDMTKKEGRFSECRTIEHVMRVARLYTLVRLLKEKKYTPKQLGFFTDERKQL